MRVTLLSIAPVLTAVLVACSLHTNGDDAASSTGAVQGGRLDTKASYAVAVRAGKSLCSGTLIAPNLVMTARHCVAPTNVTGALDCRLAKLGLAMAPKAVTITTDPRAGSTKGTHLVEQIFVPTTDDRVCGADLALLVLTQPIAATEAKPATPAVTFRMTDRSKVGTEVTVIGYGTTSAMGFEAGTRRVRERVPITCIPGDPQLDCFSESDREFATAGAVCAGDSGSGAYDQASYSRGEPIVVGILSRGIALGAECADATYTRTDRWADFLTSTARVAAARGGYPAPAWAERIADAGADADAAAVADAAADAAADARADARADADPDPTSDDFPSSSSSSSSGSSTDPSADDEPADDADAGAKGASTPSGGCSAGGKRSASMLAPWFALAAGLVAVGRRRRRH